MTHNVGDPVFGHLCRALRGHHAGRGTYGNCYVHRTIAPFVGRIPTNVVLTDMNALDHSSPPVGAMALRQAEGPDRAAFRSLRCTLLRQDSPDFLRQQRCFARL